MYKNICLGRGIFDKLNDEKSRKEIDLNIDKCI